MSYGPDGVGGPRPTTSTPGSDAAVQEAARRAAEQRAQEAAAARQRAADAQKKAVADQQAAEAARNANKQAQGDKTQAKTEVDQAQAALDGFNRNLDERGPRPGFEKQAQQLQQKLDAAKTKYATASTAADKAQTTQDTADATAKTSRQSAVDTANGALSAEKTANSAALAAGKTEPYAAADGQNDVYDAGSLDQKTQEQLFGAKSVVTPDEAAKADAQRVAAALPNSAAAASALEQQLQANPDPAYRKALIDQSMPSIQTMANTIGASPTSPQAVDATIKSLAHVAQLGGPDAANQIAATLTATSSCTTDGSAPGPTSTTERAIQALGNNVTAPGAGDLAAAMAQNLRGQGNYAAADQIHNLSGLYFPSAAPDAGQTQAQQAVQVTTVGQERSALDDGANKSNDTTRQQVDSTFTAVEPPRVLPPNARNVPTNDPNKVEVDLLDDKGNVTQRTIATRQGDQCTLQRINYENGKATLQQSSTGPNGDAHIATAQWSEAASATPKAVPTLDSLKNSRDPSVSVNTQDITHQDGKTIDHEYQQGSKGITDSTKTYYQQSKGDACHSGNGIKDDFEGKFDDKQPVDVVDTHTVTIPAGGQTGPDGKPLSPTESDSSTFSQNGLRLERDAGVQSFKVDAGTYNNCFHPAASDLAKPEDIPGVDKGDKGPVQWQLEENHGNVYDAQTFVEGHTDLSTHIHRVATGSTVTEDVTGKVPSADGKSTKDISEHSEQTYAKDGSIAHLHKDETGPDGTHTVTDFTRTTQPTPNGLQINEHTNVSKTTPDGQTTQLDRKTQSLLSGQGVQLQSSDETVTGPDGTKGRSLIDGTGQHNYINGSEVSPQDLSAYSQDAQALVTQSGYDTLAEAKNFAVKGGENALKLVAGGHLFNLRADGTLSAEEAETQFRSLLSGTFGGANVDTAVRVASGAGGLAGVAAGLVGVVGSTGELIDGIRNADFGKIASGAVGDLTSGLALKNGGQAFVAALKGIDNPAGTNLGWLSHLPGVSEEGAEAAGEFATKWGGPATAFIGVGLSGFQLYQAIEGGNPYKISEAAVGLAGASAVAAIAVGAAVGSIEPGLGTLIGAGIGLVAFGVQELIGLFDHSDTDIAKVTI